MIPIRGPIMQLKLDTPAGLVEVEAGSDERKVTRVTFQNVPAFAAYLNKPIEVPDLGTVNVDLAYGGILSNLSVQRSDVVSTYS